MPVFTDQLGRIVSITANPKRIVSLVPSQTEYLAAIGLKEEVVGITKFCVHPEDWFHTKKRIGGTKNLHLNEIISLHPDLVLANKEENVREQIEELSKSFPVWISDVNNYKTALQMMESVAHITGREKEGAAIISSIKKNFEGLHIETHPTVCYLIWQDPVMTVGGDTFIHSMLEKAGFRNVFADKMLYPQITIEELEELQPQLILLSSEPFPFREKHQRQWQEQLPKSKVLLVDGEMFSWYGSRMLAAPDYFRSLRQQFSF